MLFYQIDAGGDRNFAYLMAEKEGGQAALFDPPPERDKYLPLIDEHGLKVEFIVITHGHSDHTWGAFEAKKQTGARIVAHRLNPIEADLRVDDGDTLQVGELALDILFTPGHSEDSICILGGKKLISGDTLFVGKVGGTDYGEGARQEYASLQKLMTLDDDVEVYPGHNFGVKPSSTIGEERATNPFLLRDSLDAFIDLKKNWLQYKKDHGIK